METRVTDPIAFVLDGLRSGRLDPSELTARGLGAHLGRTSSLVYRQYGSLDGFLFAVGQAGMRVLAERLDAVREAGGGLSELSAGFVRFGLEAPALYALMFERRYDWAELRRRGQLGADLPGALLWKLVIERLRASGARQPLVDARVLFGGLHGLVSLALSGRANLGALETTDEAAAIEAAHALARHLCPPRKRSEGDEHDHHPRSAHAAERRGAAQPARQGGHLGAARGRRRRAR
jgi:AcrR family transcriptional regulator